ncbi:MAG TPA: PAS domain-containing protein [Candidatus Acidoferrales bacterium]|nr:PAS domain-containing protein [Candidatus Acidoferrales bacterium]
MDAICCRNLLIYLEPVLQSKMISPFHYSAKANGYLILGMSEGVGVVANLFAPVEREHKIFIKRVAAPRQLVTFSLHPHNERAEHGPLHVPIKQMDSGWNYLEAQKEFDKRLLAQHVPAAVFINDDLEIIHTRRNVSRYFKLAPGRASLNIVKMAREGLLYDLRNAILRAKKENKPVRKENVQIKNSNGNGSAGHEGSKDEIRIVNFDVMPIRIGNLKEPYFMILFQDAPAEPPKSVQGRTLKKAGDLRRNEARIAKLEDELTATKEYLQSVIETQEATSEELQSASEEILSSNEELQSTNEELETAKEELQSANEELSGVNDELRSRNVEVTHVNNDLMNLLASIDIAVVMVSGDLTIRRFTPRAEKVMGLIGADIDRPFLNINPAVEIADLQQMLLSVISSNRLMEKDVTDRNGTRYHVRVLPYRTSEGTHDGAVITLVETAGK